MFYDPASETVFGSMGWVDHGSLWSRHVVTGRERRVEVPGAGYVSATRHAEGLIRVMAHGETTSVSLRKCSAPDVEIAALRPTSDGWRFEGDDSLWGRPLSLVMTTRSGQQDLVLIDASAGAVRSLDLSWFNENSYDLLYQGLVDSLAFPEIDQVVVSVQRSSDLVLIDTARNKRSGTISLAGRGGNPGLCQLTGTTFAASDYDVVCRVDVRRGVEAASPVLQPPEPGGTKAFVGAYEVGADAIVVARPFSGDVVRLDPERLEIVDTAHASRQPLKVCMLSADTFLTRDWKTGEVGTGSFG